MTQAAYAQERHCVDFGTLEDWWRLRAHERVLLLLREVKIWKLADWDGCACSHFSVRGVDVDISCGKGRDRGIWVFAAGLDWNDNEPGLKLIAEEVAKQVEEGDQRGPLTIHYHKWVKGKCNCASS